ncbi:hypothetical protein BGLA2_170014 [Burkholderia gladioli]|nr:hypothetical protein BGLA2_170014 [Burkholderia gladioli]
MNFKNQLTPKSIHIKINLKTFNYRPDTSPPRSLVL